MRQLPSMRRLSLNPSLLVDTTRRLTWQIYTHRLHFQQKSKRWLPLSLPGVCANSTLFCYLASACRLAHPNQLLTGLTKKCMQYWLICLILPSPQSIKRGITNDNWGRCSVGWCKRKSRLKLPNAGSVSRNSNFLVSRLVKMIINQILIAFNPRYQWRLQRTRLI